MIINSLVVLCPFLTCDLAVGHAQTEEGNSVTRTAEPDQALLGKRLGKDMK
jgi:hypothetical protein